MCGQSCLCCSIKMDVTETISIRCKNPVWYINTNVPELHSMFTLMNNN